MNPSEETIQDLMQNTLTFQKGFSGSYKSSIWTQWTFKGLLKHFRLYSMHLVLLFDAIVIYIYPLQCKVGL